MVTTDDNGDNGANRDARRVTLRLSSQAWTDLNAYMGELRRGAKGVPISRSATALLLLEGALRASKDARTGER